MTVPALRLGAGALTLILGSCASMGAQTPPIAPTEEGHKVTPLAFSVVSVKPALPGTYAFAPASMRDRQTRILGVQKMVAPVNMFIGYAYRMQNSEALATFQKQPEWTKKKVYSVNFRAEGEPTRDQLREMMQTMLAERFSLQVHEFTRDGVVNKLIMNKPGTLGPNLKPHPAGATCATQENLATGNAPDPDKPPVAHCGFIWYYLPGNVLHVEITDTTMAAAGTSLANIGDHNELGTHPVIDATGLAGKYDLTLEFVPANLLSNLEADDAGAPTFMRALKDQLGIRVESGQGPVRMVIIDHISEATPD